MNREVIIKQISTAKYTANYRNVAKFIEYCKACDNYDHIWSCPPFRATDGKHICHCQARSTEQYSTTTIIGIKINLSTETQHKPANLDERNEIMTEILHSTRLEIDPKLWELERQLSDALLYYAGPCRICAPNACMRIENKACLYPEKMRSTLEADGYDIGRTTSELLGIELRWCEGTQLPPYFTLIYGLLTNRPIVDQLTQLLCQ